jgi:hypothetical protein
MMSAVRRPKKRRRLMAHYEALAVIAAGFAKLAMINLHDQTIDRDNPVSCNPKLRVRL